MLETSNNHAQTGMEPPRPLSLTDRVRSLRLPDRSGPPPARFTRLPWILCALLALTSGFFALESLGSQKLRQELEELRNGESPGDRLDRAGPDDPVPTGHIALESKGYIIPISLIQVSPLVGGRVLKLFIEEGKKVKKGEILAELEKVDYQAEYDRAAAGLEIARHRHDELTEFRHKEIDQAKAELDDIEAQYKQLLYDYQRYQDLKARGAVAARDFDLAQSAFLSMDRRRLRLQLAYELMIKGPRDKRIAQIKAEMDQAWADLEKAVWRLDNTVVRAPIDGIILSKKAEEGNMVNPSAFSNGLSASLCEMADLTKMEVDLAIAERDISKVFKGQKCQVRAEAFPGRVYPAVVSRIMPQADRSKGAVPVRVRIEIPRAEEGVYLRPEMGAIVRFFNKS